MRDKHLSSRGRALIASREEKKLIEASGERGWREGVVECQWVTGPLSKTMAYLIFSKKIAMAYQTFAVK